MMLKRGPDLCETIVAEFEISKIATKELPWNLT